MPLQTKAIRRRIKSVTNTRKITKAMELVAASKMRRAMQAVLASRAYARLAWNTVLSIGKVADTSLHPLLREARDARRVLIILFTSDRGLAGGFNTNMIRRVVQEAREFGPQVQVNFLCAGKRGADAMRRAGKNVVGSFTELSNNPRFADILPLSRMAMQEFTSGGYDRILLAYTDFVSAIGQKPVVIQLLPLGGGQETAVIGELQNGGAEQEPEKKREVLFEPDPLSVLNRMLPRLVETMLYQALLESSASEHSARMMSMRSASDAASDMIGALTFTFNQARQAAITQEIAEISGGKAALEVA